MRPSCLAAELVAVADVARARRRSGCAGEQASGTGDTTDTLLLAREEVSLLDDRSMPEVSSSSQTSALRPGPPAQPWALRSSIPQSCIRARLPPLHSLLPIAPSLPASMDRSDKACEDSKDLPTSGDRQPFDPREGSSTGIEKGGSALQPPLKSERSGGGHIPGGIAWLFSLSSLLSPVLQSGI